MSSSSEGRKLRLRVTTGLPSVEVYVIDGRYNLCAKGMEQVDAKLPAGLYKIKVKAGSTTTEQAVELKPENSPLEVAIGRRDLQFVSAAPLSGAKMTAERHQVMAARYSKRPQISLGSGGELFLFCRNSAARGKFDPAAGLSLHSVDGSPLLTLLKVGKLEPGEDSIPAARACCIALDPGAYRLRMHSDWAGVLERTLIVSPDWQTQLFLLRGERTSQTETSLLMAKLGRGFEPDREDLLWAEIACQGLAEGRGAASDRVLDRQLYKKFENPMLGVYVAHHLLHSPEADRSLLSRAYRSLSNVLGPHPDVLALGVWLGEAAGQFPYPPMLRSSWRIVVKGSIENADIVPSGSLAASMATRVWGSGAWLVWEAPKEESGELNEAEQVLFDYLEQARSREGATRSLLRAAVVHTETMDKMRRRIKGRKGLLKIAYEKAMEGLEVTKDDRVSEEKLVEVLGIPRAALREATAGLQRKLRI